jgi:phosphatidylglycerophosphate synthase
MGKPLRESVHSRKKVLNGWTLVHSGVCLVFGLYLLIVGSEYIGSFYFIALVFFGLGSFAALFLIQAKYVFRIPDLISLLRLVIGSVVILWFWRDPRISFGKFLFLFVASISDILDGLIARKIGTTHFGAKLDMELDAFFMLTLSIIVHFFLLQGQWVLAFGLMRYTYVYILIFFPRERELPRVVNKLEKTACAVSVFSLLAFTASLQDFLRSPLQDFLRSPLIWLNLRVYIGFVALTTLCISFLIDFIFRVFSSKRRLSEERLS